jgi:transglutaminase/protease-like cytokinesis protein 3
MASVFGANYQNWYNKYSPGDLCTTISLNEYYQLPYTFRLAVLPITELKFSSEMKVCSYSRILLNSGGISQTNYENLKNMFQLCTNIKNATSNMNDTDKARYIHDIIIDLLTPASSKDNWQDYDDVYYAPACLNRGIAYCTAYANLYYIIGRMCGLNVGYDEHPSRNHVLNTITIDGVTTYVDVIWDDDVDQYKYFMTDHCRFSSDHQS